MARSTNDPVPAGNLVSLTRGFPPFRPPPVLRNPHLQTVIASRKPRRYWFGWNNWEYMEINLGREGRIAAEVSWQPGKKTDSPVLFLLHGLEGSARSHYLVGISKKAYAAGFHTVRVNTRNCGGTEHMTRTLYCAGLSQDVSAIVGHLQQECRVGRIYAAGVSLGANILLKYLGEEGERAAGRVQGAAALSPPIDLGLCALPVEDPAFEVTPLFKDELVAILPSGMKRIPNKVTPAFATAIVSFPNFSTACSIMNFIKPGSATSPAQASQTPPAS